MEAFLGTVFAIVIVGLGLCGLGYFFGLLGNKMDNVRENKKIVREDPHDGKAHYIWKDEQNKNTKEQPKQK